MNYNTLRRAVGALIERPRLAATLIGILALAPRILVAMHLPAGILWPDGERYVLVANHLIDGIGFGSLADNQLSVPTQPLLIALVRMLFGDSYLVLRIFFAVMGAATALLGYELARRIFGPAVALLAGLGLALYPHFIYLSALFEYPQPFFMFAMAVAFLGYYNFRVSGGIGPLILCGFSLGLAVLSVPTIVLFVPLLLFCMLVDRGRRGLAYMAVLLLTVAIPAGLWSAHNYAAWGSPIFVNKAGGFNFWMANSETYYTLGKKGVTPPCGPGFEQTSFCVEFRALHRGLKAQPLTEEQLILREDSASWQKGIEFLRDSPTRAAILSVRKFAQYWSPVPDAVHSGNSYAGAGANWIAVLSYLPVLILGLLGIALSIARWRSLLAIYFYFAVFMGTYSIFMPTTRYRLPLDFFLIIFSAYTLTRAAATARAPLSGPGAPRHAEGLR